MNKDLLKSYEQMVLNLKRDSSEEYKQQYLMLFKELELQLNKTFYDSINSLENTGKNLKEEIRRVDLIIKTIMNRQDYRKRMIKEHKELLGYEPLDLVVLEELDQVDAYNEYKNNLMTANNILVELIRSGKRLKSLEAQILRNPKNYDFIKAEIKALKKSRNDTLASLKNNKSVLEDLYNFALTAPYNEENAYINYLIIKIKPLDNRVINDYHKRIIRGYKKEEKKEVVKNELPKLQKIGSVKPNGYISNLEKAMQDFDDVELPTNGLLEDENTVTIDISSIQASIKESTND